jgi:hypothetical protein
MWVDFCAVYLFGRGTGGKDGEARFSVRWADTGEIGQREGSYE